MRNYLFILLIVSIVYSCNDADIVEENSNHIEVLNYIYLTKLNSIPEEFLDTLKLKTTKSIINTVDDLNHLANPAIHPDNATQRRVLKEIIAKYDKYTACQIYAKLDSAGLDSRKEIKDIVVNKKEKSKGVGIVYIGSPKEHGDSLKLISKDYECKCVKFRDQKTLDLSGSTSFVINDSIILLSRHQITAGENFKTIEYPSNLSVIFNFEVKSDGTIESKIDSNEYFVVKKIIRNKEHDVAAMITFRKIPKDKHLDISKKKPKDNTKFYMIGHPLNLPKKISENGNILKKTDDFLYTDLENFSKNSGSPVFNNSTGFVEGIMIHGCGDSKKIQFDANNRCHMPLFVTDTLINDYFLLKGCEKGEKVIRITKIKSWLDSIKG